MDETRERRGFAVMDQEKRLEIARKGGASVPKEKRSFFVNGDLARAAGRKGGLRTKQPIKTAEIERHAGRNDTADSEPAATD